MSFQCADCQSTFTRKDSLTRHRKRAHEPKEVRLAAYFKCDQCNKEYSTRDGVRQHKLSVHENQLLRCHECDDKTFTRVASLLRHVEQVHIQKVVQDYLAKSGLPLERLKNMHSLSHHFRPRPVIKRNVTNKPKVHACRYCSYRSNRPYCLRRHLKTCPGLRAANQLCGAQVPAACSTSQMSGDNGDDQVSTDGVCSTDHMSAMTPSFAHEPFQSYECLAAKIEPDHPNIQNLPQKQTQLESIAQTVSQVAAANFAPNQDDDISEMVEGDGSEALSAEESNEENTQFLTKMISTSKFDQL